MKILYFILAVYVVLLSVKPCCTDDKCCADNHSAQTEKSARHQDNADCKGDCSPFFTCGSCTGFNFPAFSFSLKPSEVAIEKQVSVYSFSFSTEFFSSIWQPPKIG
ncbi:MAG TPA: DUF6660 family protein [Bacteroidia bacterium]|nr:DUF6660 family protein [Bacteroidia bacterium]